MKKHKEWTCAEELRLIKEYKRDPSTKRIADFLGRSHESVKKRLTMMVHAGRVQIYKRPALDLVGRRFGNRVVVERDTRYNSRWFVRCDCGRHSSVCSSKLAKGIETMCKSCAAKKRVANDEARGIFMGKRRNRNGERLGHWTLSDMEPPTLDPWRSCLWIAICDCGTQRWKKPGALLRYGQDANCGCQRGKKPNRNELAIIPGNKVLTTYSQLS